MLLGAQICQCLEGFWLCSAWLNCCAVDYVRLARLVLDIEHGLLCRSIRVNLNRLAKWVA